jgi:hypothetical protein
MGTIERERDGFQSLHGDGASLGLKVPRLQALPY